MVRLFCSGVGFYFSSPVDIVNMVRYLPFEAGTLFQPRLCPGTQLTHIADVFRNNSEENACLQVNQSRVFPS